MQEVILAPYVRVGFLNGILHFGFGSIRQIIKEQEIQNCILDAAAFLKTPQYMEEIGVFLNRAGYSIKTIQTVLDILSKNFLIHANVYNKEDRHSRSLLFYSLSGGEIEKIQKNISNKKVAIVGCGGIGNIVSVLLATAGVEEFILIDKDHIELSNLNRQLMFEEADCDQYKTIALHKALKKRSSVTRVTEIQEFIDKDNIYCLKDVDFILMSGDQANALDLINIFAVTNNIPFINVGYVEDIAVWGPLVIPGKSGCYKCQTHLVNFNNLTQDQISKCKKINQGYQAPSCGPINMIASSFAALDILKLMGNFGSIHSLNTRIGIWSHDLHIEKQDYSLNSFCEVCGFLQKIK